MSTQTRFGSFARADTLPLIEEFASKYGVSRAAITETLVAGLLKGQVLADEHIRAIVEEGKAYISEHRVDGRKQRAKLLRGVTTEELEQILKERQPGEPAP